MEKKFLVRHGSLFTELWAIGNGGDTSCIAMSLISKIVVQVEIFTNGFKVDIVYVIVLITLVCCSCRCTMPLHNACMWIVSGKAGQSELNDTRTSGVARGGARGAMAPPKLSVNVFFVQ